MAHISIKKPKWSCLFLANFETHGRSESLATKIENEDGPILRLHAKFGNDQSMHALTQAQNVRAPPISHRRSDLRVWSPK